MWVSKSSHGSVLGAFAAAAQELSSYGLAVIPMGGNDGKTPLIKGWPQRRLRRNSIIKLADKHPGANVGIVCALSGITVVDIDDPAATDAILARCGDTPIKIQTPSGGMHLYYRHAGEASANLRAEGIDADVKARGGLVVAPPSVRLGGGAYRFVEGSWANIGQLPKILGGSLSLGARRRATPVALRQAMIGQRNDALFAAMRRSVKNCTS